jgi:hypothetical protein
VGLVELGHDCELRTLNIEHSRSNQLLSFQFSTFDVGPAMFA